MKYGFLSKTKIALALTLACLGVFANDTIETSEKKSQKIQKRILEAKKNVYVLEESMFFDMGRLGCFLSVGTLDALGDGYFFRSHESAEGSLLLGICCFQTAKLLFDLKNKAGKRAVATKYLQGQEALLDSLNNKKS